MYAKGKILGGLVVFVAAATFPFWYGFGRPAPLRPAVSLETPEIRSLAVKECVEPASYMRSRHMELLKSWMDTVVRDGDQLYANHEGRKYPMSLSQTCLGCHSNKEEFCDTCHAYSGVRPDCWSCHAAPKRGSS